MRCSQNSFVLAIAIGGILSACTQAEEEDVVVASGPGYRTFVETKMKTADDGSLPPGVPLMDFTDILADDAQLRGAISRIGPHPVPTDDADLIQKVRRGGGGNGFEAPGLTGVGGLAGHALLDAAEQRLVGPSLSPKWTAQTTSGGKITNYAYDPATGSGLIYVDTEVRTTATHENPQVPPREKSTGYRFQVRVDGGFAVRGKTPTNDPNYNPNDVFPNTGIRINEVKAANFQYKLYATGTSIKIDRVWVDRTGNGSYEEILPTSSGWKAQYKNLLEEAPGNCIDMMFAPYGTTSPFIPTTYAELMSTGGPPQYCLGRCGNPPLINTR